MPTSDGISTEDWNGVHELTVNVVNAETEDTCAVARRALLARLDELEGKYGPMPSILATRADFIGDQAKRIELLQRAHQIACARHDHRNILYIAHSLAELYIDDCHDGAEGRKWLAQLKRGLVELDDSWFAEEHERLLTAADELDRDRR